MLPNQYHVSIVSALQYSFVLSIDVGAYAGWLKNTVVTDIITFKNRIKAPAVKRIIFNQIRNTSMHC